MHNIDPLQPVTRPGPGTKFICRKHMGAGLILLLNNISRLLVFVSRHLIGWKI
jgi:hypothetical protein